MATTKRTNSVNNRKPANTQPRALALAVATAFLPWFLPQAACAQTPPPAPAPNTLPVLQLKPGGGDGTVNTPQGTLLQIDQRSQRMILEGSFTVGSAGHVNFSQPGRSSVVLVNDTSGMGSRVFGMVTADGQFFLSNTHGVYFAPGARVEAAAMIATTLKIADQDFMNGVYNWYRDGSTGSVWNQGEIITANGYTALIGPQVRNDGLIVAHMGSVVLAAGDRVSLDLLGDGLISVSVDQAAFNASVVNTGTIEADGGTVLLRAHRANALLDTVINTSGVIRANALVERNGEIILDGGNADTVQVAGLVQAGGNIEISAGGTLNVGSTVCCFGTQIVSASQDISAGWITVGGGATVTTTSGAGSQTITTPGTLLVRGGILAGDVGIFHNGSGEQRITAGNIEVRGGSGASTRAIIASDNPAAEQRITVAGGNINVTGGTVGDNNQAIIRSAGNQTIDGNPNIALRGGASSGAVGNNIAAIHAGVGKTQTINAGTISLISGAGGINSGAVLLAPTQVITTTGDVRLSGNTSGGPLAGVRMGGLSIAAAGVNTATNLTLNAGGDLVLTGGNAPGNVAIVGSTGGQPQTMQITAARDVVLGSPGGSTARIGNVPPLPGNISVSAGRDILVNGGGEITSGGMLTLEAGRALNVTATSPLAGNALVVSNGGQTITAQSVNLTAQNGRRANIENFINGNQTITATASDMNLQVPGGFGVTQIINNAVGGNQTITVDGQLNVLGGVISPATSRNSGIFKNGPGGLQSVAAAGITLQGASSGTMAGALISSQANQEINVAGGNINLMGGNGGNTNNASISATGQQTITAHHINLSNGVGGVDTVAGIFGGLQTITATGNVTLTSQAALVGGAAGGPGVRIGAPGANPVGTNLTLHVGGNLVLNGGTANENGAAIGSSGAAVPPAPNNISIEAGGNVILNAGNVSNTGVRIGSGSSGTAGGNITIEADGSLQLNGTQRSAAIRTLGNVTLEAASISEAGNGFILANTLTTKSTGGDTSLTGPNQVSSYNGTSSGELSLTNSGMLTVTGLNAGGDAALNHIGNVRVNGAWTAGSTSTINVASDIVLDAALTSPEVVLNAGGGSISEVGAGAVIANTLTTHSGGATTLAGENRVANYSGTSGADLFFFNRGALDVNHLEAASANLSNDGNVTISGSWSTAAQTNITAFGPGASLVETPSGFIQATGPVGLHADGSIDLNGPNQIDGTLSAFSQQGDVSLTNVGDLNFAGSAFFGGIDLVNTGMLDFSGFAGFGPAGHINLTNTGALNVRALSGSDTTVTNHGPMMVSGFWNSSTTSITTFGVGSDLTVTNFLQSNGPMSLNIDGALKVEASGLQAASLTAFGGQSINARSVEVTSRDGQFASIGNNNSGEQTITVSGGGIDIQSVSGGGFAFITNGFGAGGQTISASGGPGVGVRSVAGGGSAQINNFGSGNQTINVSGGAVEIETLSGNGLAIVNNSGTGSQAVTVSGGSGVHLRSSGGFAQLSNLGGAGQAISVSGGGGVEVETLAPNGFATMFNGAGSQAVSVSGGTGVAVRSGGGSAAIGNNGLGGQAINVAGATGVDVQSNGGNASIVQTAGGVGQSITVTDGDHIKVLGAGGNASIFAQGNQTIAMTGAGPKQITLGDHAAQGRSTIQSNGNQTITGNADITLIGGSGPIADGSNAIISVGNASRVQRIDAGNITLANSMLGGNNSVAGIQAANQVISATGNVTLTANASGGTLPGVRIGGLGGTSATTTNLTLNVGGDLILSGGAAVNNGVGIGSTAAAGAPALANNITINAGGSVILNSGTLAGTGARIGSSATTGAGAGNISITAGDGIELNGVAQGTAIRTLGTVTLNADHISEAANGFIVAGTLNTTTHGDAILTGPNRVASFNGFATAGDVTLNNTGTLTVTGLNAFNAALTNQGDVTVSGPWNSFTTAITTTGIDSDLAVNNVVTSSGAMNVNVAGDIAVTAGGAQDAMLRSFGGQTINARSLAVTSNDGRFAAVWNTGPSAQAITLTGGDGVDVQTLSAGGFAQISADAGGSQTIHVVDGGHINVNGAGGVAGIYNFGGTQTLSITGSGANALTLGTAGALGPSQILGGVQHISAGASGESGSISIVGADGNATFTGISSGQIVGGTQTVSTSGTLRISGGSAPNQPPFGFATGLFHNGSGEQRVNAADIEMQGGPSGVNNTAIIISSGGAGTIPAGNQVINAAGNIELAGGAGGINNTAIIVSFADQTVNAGGVELRGGAGGVNNGAFINIAGPAVSAGNQLFSVAGDLAIAGGAGGNAGITGSANRQQTIFADDISLTNTAAGGNNSVGFILGGHQEINASGNVMLTARASGGDLPGVRMGGLAGAAPTATDLTLNVGSDLILTAGAAANNGVGIGSTAAAGVPPIANDITINTGGSVILNSGTLAGTGARIGSPATATGPGDISITAGGGIELNGVSQGTAIRTLGTVTLVADHITEAANGFIVAGTLNTTTHGDATLIGPNRVSSFTASSDTGNVSLTNTAPVLTLGSMALPGSLSIDQTGTLSIPGTVSALSHAIEATGDVLVGSAGATNAALLSASDSISIATPGDIIVRGSDVTPLASSEVVAGGALNFSAGNVSLIGGSAPGSFAQVTGHAPIDISAAGNVSVAGGSGDGAFARILGYSDINLTVGGFITLNAGTGLDAWARIQTVSRDSVITLNFPNLAGGGYRVNGIEGLLRDGHTGFLSDNGVAAPGHQLITIYGAP